MGITHITPEEAVELYNALSLESYYDVQPFVQAYLESHPKDTPHEAIKFCAILAFNAGRVEGIRGERENVKNRRDKARKA